MNKIKAVRIQQLLQEMESSEKYAAFYGYVDRFGDEKWRRVPCPSFEEALLKAHELSQQYLNEAASVYKRQHDGMFKRIVTVRAEG